MMKRYQVHVDGEAFDVTVQEISAGSPMGASMPQPMVPQPAPAMSPAPQPPVAAPAPAAASVADGHVIEAPMPGKVLKIHVEPGDTVKSGDGLLVLEAMKMENDIMAPIDGTIKAVNVRDGDAVNTGDVLVVFEA